MMLLQNQDWRKNYDQTVIKLIHTAFPPDQQLTEIDGTELVSSSGAECDAILRDFTHKTWDQVDHALITTHQDAPLLFSMWSGIACWNIEPGFNLPVIKSN